MLGFLAETPIHPGAGRSLGVIDLPVAREAASGYPVVVGSSLKGSLLEAAKDRIGRDDPVVKQAFGHRDGAGDILVSDARLLLLPVRSLAMAACWVTCPRLLERFGRDLARAGFASHLPVPRVPKGRALAASGTELFLEERLFTIDGAPDSALVAAIRPFLHHDVVGDRLQERLVVLNDDDFAWFSDFGLPVNARNHLEDDTKRSQNLWYEETLPPDTVMYALLLSRKPESLAAVTRLFEADRYLQVGGNATVGQGWFAVTTMGGDR